jgi:Rrf2 family protein
MVMKLTRAAVYALTALAHLARKGEGRPVASHDVAAAEDIPERFLLKLLKPLVDAGVLRSLKGPNGGFRLARPPQTITLLEVVEAVEEPVRGLAPEVGDRALDRRLQAVCERVVGVVWEGLGGVTVRDLPGGARRGEGLLVGPREVRMQKLVTVCLSGYNLNHGAVEEHLGEYLGDGWRIISVAAAGGSSGSSTATAWVAVVLEKGHASPPAAGG